MYQHTAAAEPLDPRASNVFCCDFHGGDDDFTTNGNFHGFFCWGTLRQEEKAILMGKMSLKCAIACCAIGQNEVWNHRIKGTTTEIFSVWDVILKIEMKLQQPAWADTFMFLGFFVESQVLIYVVKKLCPSIDQTALTSAAKKMSCKRFKHRVAINFAPWGERYPQRKWSSQGPHLGRTTVELATVGWMI